MDEEVVVEKGIPVPSKYQRDISKAVVAAIEQMEIGDCFSYEDSATVTRGRYIRYVANRLGKKLSVRKLHGNTYRAWRVK